MGDPRDSGLSTSSRPTYIAGYEKIKTIGKGAFGTAILAKRDDGEEVVLKEVTLTDLTAPERQMALNEVEVLKILHHPNIVRYLNSFEYEGMFLIEMEYADGGTLSQYLAKTSGPLPEEEIINLFKEIVSAIDYMHNNNILHRDLKTANVFLTKSHNIKVGDFGIAKIINSRVPAQTVLGTPYYISPEMCEGKKYNQKSDIWALGCILHEMTCRRKTFQGTNLPTLVKKIMKGAYDPIPEVYSKGLNDLIKSILQLNPGSRPTAKQIIKRLDVIKNELQKSQEYNTRKQSISMKHYVDERSVLYQLSGSDESFKMNPIKLPPDKKILKFAASSSHFLALTSDFVVHGWGEGKRGQLGIDDVKPWIEEPIPINALVNKAVVMVGAGEGFSVFVTDSGLVLTCGDGESGCLGHGNTESINKPKLIEAMLAVDVVDLACGDNHVAVISAAGKVYTWGKGPSGDLELIPEERSLPVRSPLGRVSCGEGVTAVITAMGKLLVRGSNNNNRLGLDSSIFKITRHVAVVHEFREVTLLSKWRVKAADFGPGHGVILTQSGLVLVLGHPCDAFPIPGPRPVVLFSGLPAAMISCGTTYTVVGVKENAVFFWGTRYTQVREQTPGTDLSTDTLQTESVENPKLLLELYSSERELSEGRYISLSLIVALWHCIMVVVDTTAPFYSQHVPGTNANSEDSDSSATEYDSFGPVPDWIKKELAVAQDWPEEYYEAHENFH